MSWLNREEKDVPEKLKGMTEEQILESVSAKETQDTRIKELEDERESSLGQVATLGTELAEMRGKMQALEANPQPPPPDPNAPVGPPSVLVDEDAAFNSRLAPMASAILTTGAASAEMLAKNQIASSGEAKIYEHYEKEIREVISQTEPAQRIHPETFINAFSLVKGRHLSEIMESKEKHDGVYFVEGSGSPPLTQDDKKEDKLTDQEIDVAKKMNVKPEDYLKQKKEMNFANVQ